MPGFIKVAFEILARASSVLIFLIPPAWLLVAFTPNTPSLDIDILAIATALTITGHLIASSREFWLLNKSVRFSAGDIIEVANSAISLRAILSVVEKYKWKVVSHDVGSGLITAVNEDGIKYTFRASQVKLIARSNEHANTPTE